MATLITFFRTPVCDNRQENKKTPDQKENLKNLFLKDTPINLLKFQLDLCCSLSKFDFILYSLVPTESFSRFLHASAFSIQLCQRPNYHSQIIEHLRNMIK